MRKSKLGLPAGIMAAIMYMTGLFGGYFPALLVAGFVLLCEEENFIRRSAIKTLVVLFVFSIANVVLSLIPDIVGIFQTMLSIFWINFGTEFFDKINILWAQTLELLKTAVLLVLTVLAFFGKTIDLPLLNKWADK